MNTPSLIDLKALKNLVAPRGQDAGLLKAETSASFTLHLNEEQQTIREQARSTPEKRDDLKADNREARHRQEAKTPADKNRAAEKETGKAAERETRQAEQPRGESKADGAKENDQPADNKAADREESAQRPEDQRAAGAEEPAGTTEEAPDTEAEAFLDPAGKAADDQQLQTNLQLTAENEAQFLNNQTEENQSGENLTKEFQAEENSKLTAAPLLITPETKAETPALSGKTTGEIESALQTKAPLTPGQTLLSDKGIKPELNLTSQGGPSGEATGGDVERGVSDLAKTIKDAPVKQEAALSLAASNKETHSPILQGATPQAANLLLNAGLQGAKPDAGILSAADNPDGLSVNGAATEGKGAVALNGQLNGQLSGAKPLTPNLPTHSIAMTIAQKAQNGVQQFEIRLNPPELGRVDVRLEFGRDGQVTTHLIVERPETLDMLNKDARQLERALENAGVNLKDTGLTFSLKDQNQAGNKQSGEDQESANNSAGETGDEAEDTPGETVRYHPLSAVSGLDISV